MTSKKIKHYLLTLPLGPHIHVHAYVMTDDRRQLAMCIDRMIGFVEAADVRCLPIFLQTELDTGSDIVREIVGGLSQEAKQGLETSSHFHFSLFALNDDHPDDRRLMELH